MKFIAFILLFAFTLSSILSSWLPLLAQEKEQPRLTLGVIPFSPAGVKEHEAISLSNRLHSELVRTQQFRVVEIERVTDVLHELGFQQTGVCNDNQCVVQVGNMLGAQWMVAGSVGKVGMTYTIDVRIVDVETRLVILTTTRNFRGEIDDLLNLISEVSQELATRTAEQLKVGSLEVSSQPVGAYVYLNGELKGRTPLTIKTVPVGEQRVEVKMTGYLDWKDDIMIQPLKSRTVSAKLKKLWRIVVTSLPANASVYLNNKLMGQTPWFGELPEENYIIKVSKPQYIPYEQKISLNGERQLQIDLKKVETKPDRLAQMRREQITPKKETPKKGHKKWLWIVGGTVVTGGVVTALLLLENAEEGKAKDVIGIPPEPPEKP